MLEGESGLNDAPSVLAVTLLSHLGHAPALAALVVGEVVWELAAGAAIGRRGGCSACVPAAGGAARLGPVPGGGAGADRRRLRGGGARPGERVPRGLRGRGGAGQRPAAARPGHPGIRRGRRLARADRPVRHARPARLAVPAARADPARPGRRGVLSCRPAGRRARRHAAVPAAAGASRRSCPGPGCAARSRSCWPRSRSAPACPARPGCSTWSSSSSWCSPWLQGPTLPWVARRLASRPAEPLEITWSRAARRAAADLLQAQIPAGSRLHGVEIFELRLPAEANIALIVRDGTGSSRARRPCCAPATGCSSSPRRRPRADGTPAARGQPGGQARRLARRARSVT